MEQREELPPKPLIEVLDDSTDVATAGWPVRVDMVIDTLTELADSYAKAGKDAMAEQSQVAAAMLKTAQLDERYMPRMIRYWMKRCVDAEDELRRLQGTR
jgi:hypothetical protein